MTNPLDWEDIVWDDPAGGQVRLYGQIPTMITPNSLRPRYSYDAVGFIEPSDIIEYWEDLTALEKESPGISLEAAKFGATAWSRFIRDLMQLSDLTAGRFPDPEPVRIHKAAKRNDKPQYFLEPDLDDEQWADLLIEGSRSQSTPIQLLRAVFTSRRWNRSLKRNIKIARPHPKGESSDYSTASVLAATWWQMEESSMSKDVAKRRDQRIVSRMKGALQDLRNQGIESPVLLVPMLQPRRLEILNHLKSEIKLEECSCYSGNSDSMEEE